MHNGYLSTIKDGKILTSWNLKIVYITTVHVSELK